MGPSQKAIQNLIDAMNTNTDHPLSKFLNQVKPDIYKGFGHIDHEKNAVSYQEVLEETRKGRRFQSTSDILPEKASSEMQYILYHLTLLRQSALRKLYSDLPEVKPDDSLLELGSGVLDQLGNSFLTAAYPKSFADQFSYCDINPEVVALSKTQNPNANIKECDICSLATSYPKQAFQQVHGLNVLDTLSQEGLSDTLSQIKEIIKPSGTLAHFMILEPYIYSTVHNLNNHRQIALPIIDTPNERMIWSSDKELITKKLLSKDKSHSLGQIEQAALEYLIELTPKGLERIVNSSIRLDSKNSLSKLAKKLTSLGSTIRIMDCYLNLITSHLKDQGYTTDNYRFQEDSKVVKAMIGSFFEGKNVVYSPEGQSWTEDEDLYPGSCRLTVRVHMLLSHPKK